MSLLDPVPAIESAEPATAPVVDSVANSDSVLDSVADSDWVSVADSVADSDWVSVADSVADSDWVSVGDSVADSDWVAVGVTLSVADSVAVGVTLSVADSVAVGVALSVADSVSVGVTLAVGVSVAVGVGDGDGEEAMHAEDRKMLVSRVTEPLRASARPSTVAPVFSVIEVSAKMVPTNVVRTSRVAELPICQKTLQG